MMTRKDYIRVAAIIHDVRDKRERQRLAEEFARWFAQDNPEFDVERFSGAVFADPRDRPRRSGSSRAARRKSRR
jgi:hypothetical protein